MTTSLFFKLILLEPRTRPTGSPTIPPPRCRSACHDPREGYERHSGWNRSPCFLLNRGREAHQMSKETPEDDPRQATDQKNTKQTNEPWKGPVEKEQKRSGPAPDLEKWQETKTH